MTRKCKCGCGEPLPPAAKCIEPVSKRGYNSISCMTKHGMAKAAEKREKEARKKHREKLKEVRRNPRAEALLAAQLLARVSRADDDGNCTCVTCGHVGKWNNGFDGGHYIAKGGCSYWMLDQRNIWPQCKACNGNGMKYGNKEALFTLFMVDEFGRDFVDHMHAMKSVVVKRSKQDYDDFIAAANAEILQHKKRIGAAR